MELKTFKALEDHIRRFVNPDKPEQFAERTKRFNEEMLRVFEHYGIRSLFDFAPEKLRAKCPAVILDVDDGVRYSKNLILTNFRFNIFLEELIYTGIMGIEDIFYGKLPYEDAEKEEFMSWNIERMRIKGRFFYN